MGRKITALDSPVFAGRPHRLGGRGRKGMGMGMGFGMGSPAQPGLEDGVALGSVKGTHGARTYFMDKIPAEKRAVAAPLSFPALSSPVKSNDLSVLPLNN